MTGYRIITLEVLVSEDEVDEHVHALIEHCCHDSSLGAVARDRALTFEDSLKWGQTIADHEEDE